MANSVLKLLAQKAKKRLSSAGHTFNEIPSEKTTFAYLSSGSYAIVANKQMIEEDPLFEKIKKLLDEGEDTICPLAKLTDKQIFNSLSDTEKERYIMDISKRYNKIKDYFMKNSDNQQK